jgi:vitamin B12 transporter
MTYQYLTLLLAFAASPAVAEADPAEAARDDIVVTANRAPIQRDQTGQAITVIDAETIRTRQTAVLSDLLRTTPGVTVTRNGTIGATTSINIRGADNDQTLVLIDGVRINDPASPGGGANLGPILTGNIARVEILRGPNSVVWGSQAIGGIISIETEAPTSGLSANLRAEGGYAGTANLAGNVGGTIGPVKASAGAYYFRTDGISSFDSAFGGRERDGADNFALNGKIGVDLGGGFALDTRAYYVSSRIGIDGGFPLRDSGERSNTRQLTLYSGITNEALAGRLKQRLAFTYTNVDRDNRDPTLTPSLTFDANGEARRVEYQGAAEIAKAATLIFGVEHEDSALRTASPTSAQPNPAPSRARVGITSGYAQAILRPIDGVTLTGGIRHDAHDRFGGETTFGANAALTPNHGNTLLRATYAEGFKAPTLFQLYSDFGNGALTPERAQGYDIGIEQYALGRRARLAVTWFERTTRNQIAFVSCFASTAAICLGRPNGTYDNVSRAHAQGIEVAGSIALFQGIDLTANYSHIDAINRSFGANFGRELARRPRDTGSVSVDYRAPFGLSAGITATVVGRSFDDAGNRTRLAGYTLVDLRAAYALTKAVELYGRIENLANDRYETIFRYGTYGRAAYAGVRARF